MNYPIAAAVGFALIFGFSFPFARTALQHIDPLHLLALRFILATAVMQGLRVLGLIRVKLNAHQWKSLLLLGFFQPFMYFICETVGIQMTSASEAGMMVAVIPIFTIFFARVFLKEHPTPLQIGAVVMSVLGVLLIGIMQASEALGTNVLGLVILLGAPLAGASFSVLSRHLSQRFRPLEMTFVMMHFGAAIFFPASIVQHLVAGELNSFLAPLVIPEVVGGVVYLGVLSSVAAFFLLNFALSRLRASQVSAFPSLTTLVAVIASVVLLGEVLYWYHWLGGGMIITGVWGANYFGARSARRQRQLARQGPPA